MSVTITKEGAQRLVDIATDDVVGGDTLYGVRGASRVLGAINDAADGDFAPLRALLGEDAEVTETPGERYWHERAKTLRTEVFRLASALEKVANGGEVVNPAGVAAAVARVNMADLTVDGSVSGASTPLGIRFVADPTMEPGTMKMRGAHGEVTIKNIGAAVTESAPAMPDDDADSRAYTVGDAIGLRRMPEAESPEFRVGDVVTIENGGPGWTVEWVVVNGVFCRRGDDSWTAFSGACTLTHRRTFRRGECPPVAVGQKRVVNDNGDGQPWRYTVSKYDGSTWRVTGTDGETYQWGRSCFDDDPLAADFTFDSAVEVPRG
jgi:hypothetical protein